MHALAVSTSTLAAVLLACVALAAAAFAVVSMLRGRVRAAAAAMSVAALRLECEIAVSRAACAAAGSKRLEQELAAMAGRVSALEARSEARIFDQAIDSARRGAGSSRLSEQFGLSRGEADLVARLHGRQKIA
jgi:TolA-binding protein